MDPQPTRLGRHLLWSSVAVLTPLLLLGTAGWLAAQRAAAVWPPVETAGPGDPAPVLAACSDSPARFEALLRAVPDGADPGARIGEGARPDPALLAQLPETPTLDQAFDGILACGGLALGSPSTPGGARAGERLTAAARLRLQRAWARSDAGDLEGAAQDFASVLRLGSYLEHGRGPLVLCATGVGIGNEALEDLERWLTATAAPGEPALAILARELEVEVALPASVAAGLVWQCRAHEGELLTLATIPAPAMMLEAAGIPLWAGWLADLLPGTATYDAPRTLAMHRQRCARQIGVVQAGGLWEEGGEAEALWSGEPSLGMLLDNPLGRATLASDGLAERANVVIEAERTLRSRRALLATRVAVERGSLAHDGLLPLQLELLVPDFLSAVPVDPVDGRPIAWVRSHGEIFTSREVVGPEGPRRLVTRIPER